jgi:hypothetical protein
MALLDQNLADLMIEVPIEWEQMLYQGPASCGSNQVRKCAVEVVDPRETGAVGFVSHAVHDDTAQEHHPSLFRNADQDAAKTSWVEMQGRCGIVFQD